MSSDYSTVKERSEISCMNPAIGTSHSFDGSVRENSVASEASLQSRATSMNRESFDDDGNFPVSLSCPRRLLSWIKAPEHRKYLPWAAGFISAGVNIGVLAYVNRNHPGSIVNPYIAAKSAMSVAFPVCIAGGYARLEKSLGSWVQSALHLNEHRASQLAFTAMNAAWMIPEYLVHRTFGNPRPGASTVAFGAITEALGFSALYYAHHKPQLDAMLGATYDATKDALVATKEAVVESPFMMYLRDHPATQYLLASSMEVLNTAYRPINGMAHVVADKMNSWKNGAGNNHSGGSIDEIDVERKNMSKDISDLL